MGLFDKLFENKSYASSLKSGVIDHGPQKKDGGHDHRYNTGDDRTPAQKLGDRKKGS